MFPGKDKGKKRFYQKTRRGSKAAKKAPALVTDSAYKGTVLSALQAASNSAVNSGKLTAVIEESKLEEAALEICGLLTTDERLSPQDRLRVKMPKGGLHGPVIGSIGSLYANTMNIGTRTYHVTIKVEEKALAIQLTPAEQLQAAIKKIQSATLLQFEDQEAIFSERYVLLDGGLRADCEQAGRFDLRTHLLEHFIGKKNKDVCLLLGGAGSGKTWFGQALFAKLWQHWDKDKPIPLWLPLLSFKDAHAEGLLNHLNTLKALQKESRIPKAERLNSDDIYTFLHARPKLFLIFDGYDELQASSRKHNFYQENGFDNWGNHVQLLITSRKEGLPQGYRRFFSGRKGTQSSELYVQPYDEKQLPQAVEHYLQSHHDDEGDEDKLDNEWDKARYLEAFKTIPQLQEFIGKPFLVKVVLEVLPTIVAKIDIKSAKKYKHALPAEITAEAIQQGTKAELERKQLTRRNLYKVFLERHYNRATKRIEKMGKKAEIEADYFEDSEPEAPNFANIVEEYTKQLAEEMFSRHVNSVTWYPETYIRNRGRRNLGSSLNASVAKSKEESHENPDWLEPFFKTKPHHEVLREASPLIRLGAYEYAFLHKSILEFYAAEHLFEGALLDVWHLAKIDLNKNNLQEEFGILELLAKRVHEEPIFKDVLVKIVKQSKYEPSVWRAAANAITILNLADVSFSGEDFQRIRIGHHGYFLTLQTYELEATMRKELKLWQAGWMPTFDAGQKASSEPLKTYHDEVVLGVGRIWLSWVSENDDWYLAARLNPQETSVSGVLSVEGFLTDLQTSYDLNALQASLQEESVTLRAASRHPKASQEQLIDWITQAFNWPKDGLGWGADLSHALLQGTDLREADLRYVNLFRAQLCDADCSYACMDEVSLGEAPYLKGMYFQFCKDQKTLIVCENEAAKEPTLTLYQWPSRRQLKRWQIRHTVASIAISDDGRWVATGHGYPEKSYNGIQIWDSTTGTLHHELLGHRNAVVSVTFSKDSAKLASASLDNTVRLWDMTTAEATLLIDHTHWFNCVSFNKDTTLLAAASYDNTVRLWEVKTGKAIAKLEGHTDRVLAVAFSPNGTTLASAGFDGCICLWQWQLDSFSLQQTLKLGRAVRVLDFSSADTGLLVSGGHSANVFEFATGKRLATFSGSFVWTVSFTPDNAQVLVGTQDKRIRLWDRTMSKSQRLLYGHKAVVSAVSFSVDGTHIASVAEDNSVCLWHTTTGAQQRLPNHTDKVYCVSLSIDTRLASAGTAMRIHLWTRPSGALDNVRTGETNIFTSVNLSVKGQKLALASEHDKIRPWDVTSASTEKELVGSTDAINAISQSADGRFIASASYDSNVRLWGRAGDKAVRVFEGHRYPVYSVSFSHNGSWLASGGGDKNVRLWSMVGKAHKILTGHEGVVWAVAFSGDDKLLASASNDADVRIWSMADFKGEYVLNMYASVYALSWHPKCYQLVTGSSDNAVRLWQIKNEAGAYQGILLWQSHPLAELTTHHLGLYQVTGLSQDEACFQVLEQHAGEAGLIGEPARPDTLTSKKVLEQRNAQAYIKEGKLERPWLDDGKNHFTITKEKWLIALVRDRDKSHHVWLLIQGIDDASYTFIKEVHLFRDSHAPTRLGGMMGKGLISMREVIPYELQTKASRYCCISWQVEARKVSTLLNNIKAHEKKGIEYFHPGRKLKFFPVGKAYNCLSFCEKHLQEIGIKAKENKNWLDCVIAVPERYLPKTHLPRAKQTSSRSEGKKVFGYLKQSQKMG